MEPINYMLPVLDAFTAGLAGFQQGQQTRANEKNMAIAREQQDLAAQNQAFRQDLSTQENARQATIFDQNNILFQQGQDDRVAAQQAAEAEAARNAAMQAQFIADQNALVDKIRTGAATSNDLAAFLATYPDYSDALNGAFDQMTEREREVNAIEAAKVATALKNGRPDVAIAMLEERVSAARNSNRLDQADMTQAMIELIRMDPAGGATLAGVVLQVMNPDAAKVVFGEAEEPAAFTALDMQAQAAGYAPGTPAYEEFMRTSGGAAVPAAFTALDMQAQAAGYAPGTPEYQNFMATRGAGEQAQARAIGEAQGSALVSAPSDMAAADRTIQLIEDLRAHPGLNIGTGMTSIFNRIPGTPGFDFQSRVNELTSGAFLVAIQQLRGMGSLSNTEGQAATAAITRMNTSTTKDEFLAALADYEAVVKGANERAQVRLGAATPVEPLAAAPAATGQGAAVATPGVVPPPPASFDRWLRP
jgi:hypothetical protein